MERSPDYVQQRLEELVRELQEEMQTLQQEIDLRTQKRNRLASEVSRLRGYFSLDSSSHTSLASDLPSTPSAVSEDASQLSGEQDATQHMVNVLARAAAPLHCRVILERLQTEEGFTMPGKDPLANLAARLRGSKKFIKVAPGFYALPGQHAQQYESPVARRPSLADQARQTLEEAQRPMRTREIRDCLQQKGLLQATWAHQSLRVTLKNHKYFECLAPGVFALKEWPPEQKSISIPVSPTTAKKFRGKSRGIQPLAMQPLTECIVELLTTANCRMRATDIRAELARRGRDSKKNIVSGALSALVKDGRINRPEPGYYTALSFDDPKANQHAEMQREGLIWAEEEMEEKKPIQKWRDIARNFDIAPFVAAEDDLS